MWPMCLLLLIVYKPKIVSQFIRVYISGLLLNLFLDYNIEVTKSYLMICFSNVQRSPYTANPVHCPQL